MKRYLLSFIILFSVVTALAQSLNADSLEQILREKEQSDTARIRIKLLLGEHYPILRIGYWDSLSVEAGRANMPGVLPVIWNNKGYVYSFRGEYDQAIRSYEKSIVLSQRAGNLKEAANTSHNLGMVLLDLGRVAESETQINIARKIFQDLGDKKGVSLCWNSIGGVYSAKGDIINALNSYNKALEVYEITGDLQGTGRVLNNIASIYDSQGDKAKALEYYKKSMSIYKQVGDKHSIASILNNLGYIFGELGNTKAATENHLASLALSEQLGDRLGVALCKINLSLIYKRQGKPDTALMLLNETLPVLLESGEKGNLSQVYGALGTVLLEKAEHDPVHASAYIKKALRCVDSSLVLARELGFPEHIARAEELYSAIDEFRGNKKGAYEHYRQYIVFRDSLANIINRKASIRDQLKYEFTKREAVLKEQQEKERVLEESAHKIRLTVLIAVIVGLIMLAGFVFWVLQTLRRTRLQKLIIETKQKEILESIRYARRIQTSMMPRDSSILRKIRHLKGGTNA